MTGYLLAYTCASTRGDQRTCFFCCCLFVCLMLALQMGLTILVAGNII